VVVAVVAVEIFLAQKQFLLERHTPLLLVVAARVERLLRPQAALTVRQTLMAQRRQ
jgi:hypothetical protein